MLESFYITTLFYENLIKCTRDSNSSLLTLLRTGGLVFHGDFGCLEGGGGKQIGLTNKAFISIINMSNP